jgi:DNA-directed RNA polymerase specialized sigma24 family protein
MATRTQVQIELMSGCIHEQMCQSIYQQRQQRMQTLCGWMSTSPESARQLWVRTFVDAWTAGARDTAAGSWDERLAAAFAGHFRELFRREAPPVPPPAASASLRSAVHALPAPLRLLYLLHELEGYSPARLGAWLDLDPSYCAQLIHEARQQLRRSLLAA